MAKQGKEEHERRVRFVMGWRGKQRGFAGYCRKERISRKTGYQWLSRYQEGGIEGLEAGSRRPKSGKGRHGAKSREAVKELRLERGSWGPKKLLEVLKREGGLGQEPSVSTIARWLKQWGLIGRRERRSRQGPGLERAGLSEGQRANEVWTVDFKGWFCTQEGRRCEPLTVRDFYSRYCLGIAILENQSRAAVQKAMKRLFVRYGLPEIIRVDNGAPFASSQGALKLSALSAWWMRLGIRVEFTRRARPGDNASHEQMHRIFKADVKPCRTLAGQQNAASRWVKYYNKERPHEGIGQRMPAELYERSARRFQEPGKKLAYPADWAQRRVRLNGDIRWAGRTRHVGRAFVGQWVGLQEKEQGRSEVYFARQLIGEMYRDDPGGMRPARWIYKKEGESARASRAAPAVSLRSSAGAARLKV